MVRNADAALQGIHVFVNELGTVSIRGWACDSDEMIAVYPDDIPGLIKGLRQAGREAKLIEAEDLARH